MTKSRVPKIWDISQVLRSELPVWPGDTDFSHVETWQINSGAPVNVSAITLSTHSGSHADAPLHYDAGGSDIAEVKLEPYLGTCQVVDARMAGPLITIEDLPSAACFERVLFRTFELFPHSDWPQETTAISPDAIDWLADRGTKLIGIDGPSIDPQNSKSMDAHMAVLRHDIRVLEGLVLDDVSSGQYELIALPLAIQSGDASPVRAILRDLA
ncbi:MAG: arylformamidase [Erythrobacter sp.]